MVHIILGIIMATLEAVVTVFDHNMYVVMFGATTCKPVLCHGFTYVCTYVMSPCTNTLILISY